MVACCFQLANVASARERLQFMERASELMPLVRFCKFHLERSGGAGQASEAELVDLRSDGQVRIHHTLVYKNWSTEQGSFSSKVSLCYQWEVG